MKLLIVRHAEPNYTKDSLTEKGFREAEYLADRLSKLDIKKFYVSPLGRAKATISPILERLGRQATECEWLREFEPRIHRPDRDGTLSWDWLPQDWTKDKRHYDREEWGSSEILQAAKVAEEYQWVTRSLDELLASHGYIREEEYYKVEKGNTDTIALFCHFGVECVLLSHLIGASPMVIWHGFCALPSSVTTVITEERRKGIASFRINGFGDLSHLYAAGEEPSFMARFCEIYENKEERHD